MIKKIFLLMTLAAGIAFASACSKNGPAPEEPKADYTLMLYGCGGGTLDYPTAKALIEKLMMTGSSEKVNYCFEYKYSRAFQTGGMFSKGMTFTGPRRWAAPSDGSFAEKWTPGKVGDEGDSDYVVRFANAMEEYSEAIDGDNRLFDLADPDHLADYIDWCMENYPAKKYILLMKDHGMGWDFYEDQNDPGSKSQISDDNLQGGGKKYYIGIKEAVEGIRRSKAGRVDAVISDECLMCTLEVLTEYSLVADYAVAAEEMTVSLDGEDIDNALSSSSDIKIALNRLVDLYPSRSIIADKSFYTDQGFYDLTQIGRLNSVVKKIGAFLAPKSEDNPDWRLAINNALRATVSASEHEMRAVTFNVREKVARWHELTDKEKEYVLESISDENKFSHYSFCLYDFLSCQVKEAKNEKDPQGKNFAAELKEVEGYFAEYDSVLRAISHIDCTYKQNADTPYQMCSVGIVLQSLNPNVYNPVDKDHLDGYCYAGKITRENALAVYKDLEFDRQTGWSAFLESIQVSATPFFNPDRQERQTGE